MKASTLFAVTAAALMTFGTAQAGDAAAGKVKAEACAHCHSLFILGWGATACFAGGLWIRDRRIDRDLVRWGAASVAVAFLNPYGWRGVPFPFTLATRLQKENPFGGSIGEFVSPLALKISEQFPFYPRLPIFAFRLLVVLAVAALVVLVRRRPRLYLDQPAR